MSNFTLDFFPILWYNIGKENKKMNKKNLIGYYL